MLLGLTYQLVRFLTDLVLIGASLEAQLRAEVLALRHQLRVLERKVGRPAWQPGDRILLAALSRLLPRSSWSALLASPETLLRWHRELVRRKWACPVTSRASFRSSRREILVEQAAETVTTLYTAGIGGDDRLR